MFRIHKSYRWVVAVCDKDLIGKCFTEGNRQIDLTGNFFKGEPVDENKAKSEILRCLREDATFNIVGGKSVGLVRDMGFVKDESIIKIGDVPFVLMLL